jgi:zinc transport system ATP-binding protein
MSAHENLGGARRRVDESISGGLCCTRVEGFGVTLGQYDVLKNVNLHIHCGELTAIIGRNGAGKSTLLRAILGEVPHSGELAFLDEKNKHTGRPLIGYVPQRLDFDAGSPTSVYDLFAAALSRKAVWFFHSRKVRYAVLRALERVDAGRLIDRRLGALSGGELQKVLLALALYPTPDLLLLDEPVSGVDHHGLQLFYQTVSELRHNYDLSIILISHDFGLVAEYADRVVLLNDGTVECAGTPEEVFGNPKVKEIFGMNLNPHPNPSE